MTGAEYDPTCWRRLNEFSRFSTMPPRRKLWIFLHPLKGDLRGLWSVTVRANWRVVFRFEGTDAFDVELID
jgi:plasmid maintenance system killer protein